MMQRPGVRIALAILVLATFIGACVLFPIFYDFGFSAGNDDDDTTTLTVGAASDLIPAFEEIGEAFEAETGIEIDFTFGSTGQIAQQIEAGAPVDVFAAANIDFIEELDAAGLVLSETIRVYARGSLVLWMTEHADLRIDSVEALTSDDVRRIAIANPDHAPYGIAARDVLQSAGLWDELEPKIVPAQNVRAALQMAETGNVDVAIVARSLANASDDGYWAEVPAELHDPIDQAIAVIGRTEHEDDARSFVDYVMSEDGQAILQRYNFESPNEASR